MAAGKNYLNLSAFPRGVGASVIVYRDENASVMSMNPDDIQPGRFVMPLDVFRDEGGLFIFAPVDPAEIPGMAALVK
jgi:hypothetical protein